MGLTNFLIEGVSGTGKTSVCRELQRRGFQAVNGDTELAYQGDPTTGQPTEGFSHQHHIWRVDLVRSMIANRDRPVTYFCGGSRNFGAFINLFDGVFVLEVDVETLNCRLDSRAADEFGGRAEERELVLRVHRTKEDIPRDGMIIDATAPLADVVDEILRRSASIDGAAEGSRPPG